MDDSVVFVRYVYLLHHYVTMVTYIISSIYSSPISVILPRSLQYSIDKCNICIHIYQTQRSDLRKNFWESIFLKMMTFYCWFNRLWKLIPPDLLRFFCFFCTLKVNFIWWKNPKSQWLLMNTSKVWPDEEGRGDSTMQPKNLKNLKGSGGYHCLNWHGITLFTSAMR